ncbi:hypothetical protein CK203_041488 [Vitis vinifera]|uniref:Uncharacterized protein n=1 Tax=Vitis vinifera TaxID=29760 RepID=A0A438HNC5_VITVI|nr:hypothetical protein CK203_041488 [Vitis vinifera]
MKEGGGNEVINGKYGEGCGWCSQEVRKGYGVGFWKILSKDWDLMSSRISFLAGNGQKVKFWKDKWFGTAPLCSSFPSLFALVVSKEAWVEDV